MNTLAYHFWKIFPPPDLIRTNPFSQISILAAVNFLNIAIDKKVFELISVSQRYIFIENQCISLSVWKNSTNI